MRPTDGAARGVARTVVVMTGAVALVLAMQGCGTSAVSGSPRTSGSGAASRGPSSGPDPSEPATAIEQLGLERFPEYYAGLKLLGRGRIVVYRRPSADFDQAVQDLALGVKVITRDAPHSAVELEALADRVVEDFGYWRDQGISINMVAPRYDGTAVEVGTLQQEEASRLLRQRYGTIPPIVVTRMGPVIPVTR